MFESTKQNLSSINYLTEQTGSLTNKEYNCIASESFFPHKRNVYTNDQQAYDEYENDDGLGISYNTRGNNALYLYRTYNTFKFKNSDIIELTFSCKLKFYNTGASAEDNTNIGLFNADPTTTTQLPLDGLLLRGSSDVDPDAFEFVLIKNRAIKQRITGFLTGQSSDTPQTYKIIIYNTPLITVKAYQKNTATNTFTFIGEFTDTFSIGDETSFGSFIFFFGIFSSDSGISNEDNTLYGYEIYTLTPKICHPILNNCIFHENSLTINDGGLKAVAGLKANNGSAVNIFLNNIQILVETTGVNMIVYLFKDPIYTAGNVVDDFTWTPYSSGFVRYSTQQSVIEIDNDYSYISSSREHQYQLPLQVMCFSNLTGGSSFVNMDICENIIKNDSITDIQTYDPLIKLEVFMVGVKVLSSDFPVNIRCGLNFSVS